MRNARLCLVLFGAAALLGCRDKPIAPPPPPAPAAGLETTLFRIGMSEDDVQAAVRAVPNYRNPDGAGFAVARAGNDRSRLEAKPGRPEEDRPAVMRFSFEARQLIQAELTYQAPDAAARAALYDRLLGGVAGSYARSTNRVLEWGGRTAWLHAPDHMLLVYESRADERAVTLRTSPPVFK